MNPYSHIKQQDEDVYRAVTGEEERERTGLELIPSENYVSLAVREAMGSVFTNKYSEGYPGKRYYGGQEFTDQVETLAIERAKKLFGADHANVQPLGGANANIAAYLSWLEPGDTVLGMDLGHGGHLTHGHPVTHMAKFYNFVRYKMKDADTGELDYEDMRTLAKEVKPKILLAGYSAYSRELDYEKFKSIADEVGAVAMADVAHIAGLIAGGVMKNPFDYGFQIVTTTTHKTLRGPRGGMIMTKGVAGNPLKAVEKTVENLPTLIDRTVFPGFQGGPHMHMIAAKAVAFGEALRPSFKEYAGQVLKNAKAMEAVFKAHNIRMLGGGTDNHLILADVYGSLNVTGGDAEKVLNAVGITLNKNAIADDTRPAFNPSGIRFGTPAITTRGFKEKECTEVAEAMVRVLKDQSEEMVEKTKKEIETLAKAHPVPESFD